MSRTASKATVTVVGNVLHFTQVGSYTIEYLPSGNVQIKLDGGKATVIKAADWAAISSFSFAPGADLDSAVRIDGVTFTNNYNTTAADGAFEANHNYRDLLGELINDHGIAWTVDNLLVNGSKADTFKLLWDFLDDAYVAGANYYNIPLNENFVRLGVKYAEYLAAGGDPLTDVIAKYLPDTNSNGIPEREQSMHDNLLGNLNAVSIQNRNFGSPLEQQLLALVPNEYESRPVYSGSEAARGGAAHDAVRAFDYDHGWNRPDYLDRSFGKVDPAASDDRNNDGFDEQMFYGNGNSNDSFNVVRHEGSGVELALKAKEFGPSGGDYGAASRFYDTAGVLHYNVSSGLAPGRTDRADWSLDYSATVLSQGADESWTFRLLIDIDETEGVNLVEIPMTTFGGQLQGSSNYGFAPILSAIDIDDAQAGVQPYAYGPGEFAVLLEAYASGVLVASNQIVVHVDGFGI